MTTPKKNIFLVDDDETANFINEMQIKRFSNNLNVLTFTCAQKALHELKNEFKVPEFIFLDIDMPNLNGWDFIDQFKTLQLNSKIVMVTSSLNPNDKQKANEIEEVIAFIEKPMVKTHLYPIFKD